jgi:hypothetical protein
LHCNVFQEDFHELPLRYFSRKLWGTQWWAHWMFGSIQLSMELTDVGGLLLESKKRFSWSCTQTAGEEAVQLIKASQSAHTVSQI